MMSRDDDVNKMLLMVEPETNGHLLYLTGINPLQIQNKLHVHASTCM